MQPTKIHFNASSGFVETKNARNGLNANVNEEEKKYQFKQNVC